MPPNVFRILVGTDFSKSASLALDDALTGAGRSEHPELHVISVIDDAALHLLTAHDRHETLTHTVDRVREMLSADVAAALARHRERSPTLPPVQPIVHVRLGGIAEQIAALATEIRADLVVVGVHGHRGGLRHRMGSVAERTVRLAPCPVMVVRPTSFAAMDGLPAIDPPCPACVRARETSNGAHWWCAVHEAQREPAHTYSFSGRLTDPHPPLNDLL